MNVVVVIEGREAIPVRALPFLTDWETMSPDVVSEALAGNDFLSKFKDLRAHRFEHGKVKPIGQRYWRNRINTQLSELSASIKTEYPEHEIGYRKWQRESWKLLPAGVFVWKDEWVIQYHRRYMPARGVRLNESGAAMTTNEWDESVALDFSPFIPEPEVQLLVMEGFETLPTDTATPAPEGDAAVPAPVGVTGTPTLAQNTAAPVELDYSLLATREQLLDAYEKWGLKPSWFTDLKGHKWLLDARRVKGQGQRGHVIEPMFCPFTVMKGLVQKVRKESRLAIDTAWRTLEHKFPKVYAEYEVYDPRERTGD